MTGKCTTAVMMHDVPYKKDDFMTEDYKGLSGSEVSQRVEAGKVNTTTNSISRTKKEIFRAHLCTFFNFLNVFLGALVLMTGQIKNLTGKWCPFSGHKMFGD